MATVASIVQYSAVDAGWAERVKLGLDVAIEALRFARERKGISHREVFQFAHLLRQDRVMAPYLESIT